MNFFEVIEKNNLRRKGRLKTKKRSVITPLFMPIATYGVVKNLELTEIEKIGFEVILANTYHLWLRAGDKLIKKAGGLSNFINWQKPILTDSGGYQVFSLGEKTKRKYFNHLSRQSAVKIKKEGVYFQDYLSGKKYFLSPEKAIDIQLNLNSDLIMCLDVCPPFPCSFEEAQRAVEITTNWAKRSKDYFFKKIKKRKNKKRPLLFGIIQGGIFKSLREKSTQEILKINFDGFAIGGVAVGEPREKLKEIIDWIIPFLPENKPRYLMGLGRPEEIVEAVFRGIDMFDCVIPTREGRHGRVFIWNEKFKKTEKAEGILNFFQSKELFYQTINLSSQIFKEDFSPVDPCCDCFVCQNYSKAYLRYLFSIKEPLVMKLVSYHNLYFYYQLVKLLRLPEK